MGGSEPLTPGAQVGRYILGPRIGEGPRGVVFRAHDPELDRSVAIKLLHTESRLQGGSRLHEATARLVHRNLVTIHDVGTFGDRLFVAMELIDGQTLRQWLHEPRSWREVLAVFRAAGEGLAAAHAAGILHLDFKLENVLLAEPWRVVVTDFGLVRPEPAMDRGAGTDDDVRGFCVALDEALSGRSREGHTTRVVPRWLRRAVQRGLAAEPADRYPDMRALLVALDPGRRITAATVGLGLGATAIAASVVAWAWPPSLAPVDYCDRVVDRIELVWNAERREALEAVFLATKEPAAADAWATVSTRIDAFAQAWVEAQHDACRAERDPTIPPEVVALHVRCLERQLAKSTAMLDALSNADSQTVLNAPQVAAGLGSPNRCADDEHLTRRERARAAVDPAVRAEIDASILRAETLVDTAKYDEALATATATLQRAREAGDGWAAAESLLAIASVHQWLEDDAAEQAYHDTLSIALEVEHDRAAAMAIVGLIELWTPGTGGRLARAEQWTQHARALVAALGGDVRIEAQLALATGAYYQKSGMYDEAEVAFEAALALQDDGANSVSFATAYANLGGIAAARGQYAEALERFRRSRDILVGVLGPRHPGIAPAVLNVGSALAELGDLEGAAVEHRQVLAILEENFGPDHPTLAPALRMLAWGALSRREFAEALPYARRALAIAEREEAGSESVARSLAMLAAIELENGDIADAFGHSQTALSLATATLGKGHPSISEFEIDFAMAATRHGDHALARQHFDAAIALRTAAMGAEDSEVGRAWAGIAELELLRGAHDAAVAAATRAYDIVRSAGMERAIGRAEAAFLLARCRMAGGDASERKRARELAELAIADFRAAGPSWSKHAEQVVNWLAAARRD